MEARALDGAPGRSLRSGMPYRSDPDHLSERETEVWALLADDWTYAQIADQLRISPHTVHRHVSSILRKTASKDRAEAGRLYRARQNLT
jgi:DNA-binding NarL/FixJ family response regulator